MEPVCTGRALVVGWRDLHHEGRLVTNGQEDVALRRTRIWLDVAALAELPDEQLLARFSAGGGQSAEAAFAALVARHGPMVLRTCRAALRNEHDAEDSFQAAFLILARRSRSLWVRESLGPWLHRVASRVAIRARECASRRKAREARAARSVNEASFDREPEDASRILHLEIDKLPSRFRGAVVLCELEGRSHEEAASQLGCAVGTIKSRLARAREKLRARLVRRGLAPATGLGSLLTSQGTNAIPTKLAQATAESASAFALSIPSGAAGPRDSVLSLAECVMKSMTLNRLAIRCAAMLAGIATAAGVFALAAERPKAAPGTEPVAAAAPVPPARPVPKEFQPFQGVWTFSLCDTMNETLYASNKELRSKWQWNITGDEIIWAFKGEEWKLKLKVDPTKKPAEIDLTFQSGEFKGTKCEGIFEWGGVDGKTLQIAIQDPGANVARPKSIFPWSSTSQTAVLLLRQTGPIDPKKELARLQGNWTLRLTQSDAWPVPIGKGPDKTGQGSERRWRIEGSEIAWTAPDGQEVKATFTIDPSKVPRRIDLAFISGPNKGDDCIGVYEWVESGDLWLCMVDPGRKADRPRDISYSTNEGRSMISLDRLRTPAEIDQQLLQGAWKFDVCESEWWPVNRPTTKEEFPKWRWTVEGNEMNWTGVSTGNVKVSFSLDPTRTPKEIDLTFLDGPHKGEKCLGVYQLKAGSFWVCLQDPGEKIAMRPKEFSSGAGTGRSFLILDPVGNKK